MNAEHSPKRTAEEKAKFFVVLASLAIPVVVGILYFMPKLATEPGPVQDFIHQLPLFNAVCNGTTAVVLILAFLAIRNKNVKLHRRLMTFALVLSFFFLLAYVTYHATMASTPYPTNGPYKMTYYFILLTHILFSAVIVPLVLISYTRGLAEKFDKHRKIAKITLPLWLYVAITGVLVYMLISPYYPF